MATLENSISLINTGTPSLEKMNNTLEKMASLFNSSEASASSFSGKLSALAGSANKAYRALEDFVDVVGAGMKFSDQYAGMRTQLDLINDGMQSTTELQDQVFASAMRSRSAYQNTADTVAKMGILAKDAFPNNQGAIAFIEQINKHFALSGISAEKMQSAMVPLWGREYSMEKH